MKISLSMLKFVQMALVMGFSSYVSEAMATVSPVSNTGVVKAGVLGVPIPFVRADTDMLSESVIQRENSFRGISLSKTQTFLTQNNVTLYESGSENGPHLIRSSEAYQVHD